MKVVIDIPKALFDTIDEVNQFSLASIIKAGTLLPEVNGFIAVCDNENHEMTEKVIDELKGTVFVGEDCSYCFDMVEIIPVEKEVN